MNQKARKFIYLLLVVTLLAQSVFMPDYVLAQEEIAIPPGAARIIENGERFMDSAPVAIGRALQLAADLEQISQADLVTLPVEELIAARQEALEIAQQTAVAQGALGGILTGADELDISGQTAVDLDALISDLGTDGFSEELETVLLDTGLTITDVANLEAGTTNNFTLRRDVAQSGFDTETLNVLQSLGLSATDIEAVEDAYANYGIADTTHANKLAQLGGTQAEFTFVRDSALIAYIQLLSQQVYQAQLLGETGRPIATADIDILVQDQLRLLTHIGYLNTLWGGETRPETGEGQWLFIERYSWQVAERLNTLILETHNLGLAVDLFIALQIHTTAITAQSGDPSGAKAELEKLAAIEAALVGDNLPGGQAALEAIPSLFWRVVIAIYDHTGDEAVLAWVNEEELPVVQSAVIVAKDQAYGRMARLAKPVHFPALSGSIDESDETNNTDLALFYTSRAALPDNILSLLEGFIPHFEDVLDFVWGVISGQSDNPLAIGINIVLSFVPVLGEVLDLIALFTEPTVWGKAMALIGLAASIASDGSELLSFLGIGIPAAITTEVADIAASILKNVTRFVSNSAASVIARIPFDQALRRGVEVIEFIGRRIIEGGGDLITRIGNVLTNSRDAFSALLTRFGNNLEALYRIGFRDGGYLVGRLLHLSDDAAAYSDEVLESVAHMGDDLAEGGIELGDEAVEGLGEASEAFGEQSTREIFAQCFLDIVADAPHSFIKSTRISKLTYHLPFRFQRLQLCNDSLQVFSGLSSLAQNGVRKLHLSGIDVDSLLLKYANQAPPHTILNNLLEVVDQSRHTAWLQRQVDILETLAERVDIHGLSHLFLLYIPVNALDDVHYPDFADFLTYSIANGGYLSDPARINTLNNLATAGNGASIRSHMNNILGEYRELRYDGYLTSQGSYPINQIFRHTGPVNERGVDSFTWFEPQPGNRIYTMGEVKDRGQGAGLVTNGSKSPTNDLFPSDLTNYMRQQGGDYVFNAGYLQGELNKWLSQSLINPNDVDDILLAAEVGHLEINIFVGGRATPFSPALQSIAQSGLRNPYTSNGEPRIVVHLVFDQ